MRKKIYIIVIMILAIIGLENVYADSLYGLKISCEPTQVVPEDTTKKYTLCEIVIDNSNSILKKDDKLSFILDYATPGEKQVEILNGKGATNNFASDKNGATFDLYLYDVPNETFALLNIKITTDYESSAVSGGATLTISSSQGEESGEILASETYSLKFSNICKKIELKVDNNRKTNYYKRNGYIYALYSIDNIENESEYPCKTLTGMEGKIDLETLPEGLKIIDGYLSTENSEEVKNISGIILNPENGKWAIDFDLTQNGVEIQKNNSIVFVIKMQITDSTKLNNEFSLTMKDFSYIGDNGEYLTTTRPGYSLKSDFKNIPGGDWDGSGSFQLIDLIKYRIYLANPYALNEKQTQIVDIREDGNINLSDLILARRILVELPLD